MTNYEEIDGVIFQDFARRTLVNLEFIEAQNELYRKDTSGIEVFEVTQFINSLLGLLVFPKETFWGKLKETPLKDIPSTQAFRMKDNYDKKCEDLPTLIYHLRNGISHCRVEFPTDKNYISKIEICDEKQRKNRPNEEWTAEIDIPKFRVFMKWFILRIIDGSLLE